MFRLGGPQNSVGTEFRQNILLLHVHTSVGIAIKFRGIPSGGQSYSYKVTPLRN